MVKLLQFLKALVPILFTFVGIVILFSLLHPLNALLPTVVKLAGSVTFVRLLQFAKASIPMLVTFFPTVTVFIFLLFLNAFGAISVTL